MGIGNFFGMLPLKCRAAACMVWNWIPSPAGVTQKLYPNAKSKWLALKRQTAELLRSGCGQCSYTGNYKVSDKPYDKLDFPSQLFLWALDQVRPGGVVAFVTSRYTIVPRTLTQGDIWRRGRNCLVQSVPNDAFKEKPRYGSCVRHPVPAKA